MAAPEEGFICPWRLMFLSHSNLLQQILQAESCCNETCNRPSCESRHSLFNATEVSPAEGRPDGLDFLIRTFIDKSYHVYAQVRLRYPMVGSQGMAWT